MRLGIGIGTGLSLNNSGVNWISYWTTREPSGIAVTITGATTATVTWTDSAVEGADGYKVYVGATLKATVAIGVETGDITGLAADTEYVFKVVAYKGDNESTGVTDTDSTFTTDYNAVYAQFLGTKPDKTTTSKGNTLFKDIVTIQSKLDFLFTFAHSTNESNDHLINWINPSTRGSLGGTASTFRNMVGLKSNGVDGYIKSGIIPSTLTNYTSTNCSIGVFIATAGAITTGATFSVLSDTNRVINGLFTGNAKYCKINDNTTFATFAATKAVAGLHSLTRTGTTKNYYFDDTLLKSATVAATGVPTKEIYINATNNDGTAEGFQDDEVSFFYGGAYLTTEELTILKNAFYKYLYGDSLAERFDSLSRNSITVESANNPEGELVFDYDYSYFKLSANPTIYKAGATVAHIAVFIDNVYDQIISYTAVAEKDVFISGQGTRRITLVEGLTTKDGGVVKGTFITGLKAGSSYLKITEGTIAEKLVILGDSIGIGGNATVPASEGFAALFRASKSVALVGYGNGTLSGFAANAGLIATTVGYFETLFINTTTKKIIINLGTNDHGLLSLAAATFQAYYENLLDGIHALDENIKVYCLSPILRGDASEDATLDDYRTRIGAICTARSSYCTHIAGKTILTYPDDYDGVLHPTTGGHLKIYTALDAIIYP